MTVSTRAQVITRRTYSRPLNDEGTVFETWEQIVSRVISHQKWLWERALTHKNIPEMPLHDLTEDMLEWVKLDVSQLMELNALEKLLLERKVSVAGRTLWLGGTTIGKKIELSQFNCCFITVRTIHDMVDFFWGLLNGAGVTGLPEVGTLTGFRKKIPTLEIIRTIRDPLDKGPEFNTETWDAETSTWTITVGDSAVAWAKSIGKLLAGKFPAKKLVLDFSRIRGPGARLKNYGWLSQSDTGLSVAYKKIFEILNSKADSLLTEIDIGDIINLLGTVLSTRRAAEALLMYKENPRWKEFALCKKDMWSNGNSHRAQSNNSLLFNNKPTKQELVDIFEMINKGGNGEPGLVNVKNMLARAPWAKGLNPCFEILLADGNTCNLVTIDLGKFKDDTEGLLEASKLIARANYRQTVVDFRDGVLQEKWHLNNEHLHLCGVSLMGIALRPDMQPYDYTRLERVITHAAYSMADELGTSYPKNITANKPEGSISKCYDSTEGMHTPLGKYILNNVAFSKYDPLVAILKAANYNVFNHPYDDTAVLITFPVKYEGVEFTEVNGKEINIETAISQLERYKMLMNHYCHQNVSCTISYSIEETPEIVNWLYNNWDSYVAVAFLFRNDPSKTAADLGYPYLPQEVTTKEIYEEYSSRLAQVDLDDIMGFDELLDAECATGACPVR
jgi:adenosylcobalamin-dependent ribonucleoside-triphosphate reductase